MKKHPPNPQVDAYLVNAADFAKPILAHVRQLLHKQCPGVIEAVKWGLPHFDYQGESMCVFAAYKKHCSFTFLKESIMSDARLKANPGLQASRRYMGKLSSLSDLPADDQLVAYINEAMALNEQGVKLPERTPQQPNEIAVPDYFAQRLASDPKARQVFEGKSGSFRKEYLIWITDARTEATRNKRMDEALAWIAEGKGRFWKYAKG
jgi:uncharacterized protein YdeI (YjbR/CyaY-like superfamily)